MGKREQALAICDQNGITDPNERMLFVEGFLDGYVAALEAELSRVKTTFPGKETR